MSEIADVNDILRCFPGPVVLFRSRGRWAGVIAGGGCLTIASAILVAYGSPLRGILGLLFFGTCTIVGIAMLLPGSSSLRLDRESFTWTRLYRTKTYRWSEVSDFCVWGLPGAAMFEVANPRLTVMEMINKTISGRPEWMPDTYGLAPDRLVQLMTEWRNLAIGEIR